MKTLLDMLISIKNGQMAGAERVMVPLSATKLQVANILKDAGFLSDVSRKKKKSKKMEHEWLDLGLKYEGKLGSISGIRFISRPSRRIYAGVKDLKPVRSGFGTAVISTPKGIMTSREAKKAGVGGEMLFEIW